MTELKIPDAAVDAQMEAWHSHLKENRRRIEEDFHDALDAAIDAVMPLAFAAELRELVRELEKIKKEMRDVDGRILRSSGLLSTGISFIRNRIVELDPEGITA